MGASLPPSTPAQGLVMALQLPTIRLTAQCGQTKPLMFSTMPITRNPVFLQKVSSRLTSPTDTAWRPRRGRTGQWASWTLGQDVGKEQGQVPARVRWHTVKWDDALQYLGRGDHESPQGVVGAQGIHCGHVLVRGPWGRVHNQVVQLPPGHVRHKLLYQRCKDPGRSDSRELPKPTTSTGLRCT